MKSQFISDDEKKFDHLLNAYKYRKVYRIQKKEDGIHSIICKRGEIEPYSLTELCCYQEFKSRKGIAALKLLIPDYCTITQEVDREIIFKFPLERLDEIAMIVKAKKRRVLSEEQKERLREMAKPFLFKKCGIQEPQTAV